MYGFRLTGPVRIGASRLPPSILIGLNMLGTLLFVLLGYFVGGLVEPLLHSLDQHIKYLFPALATVAIIWLIRRLLLHFSQPKH